MKRTQRWLKRAGVGLCASALFVSAPANAQDVATDQQGIPTCIQRARAVPGLEGLPVWPSVGGARLNTVPPDPVGSWTRPSDRNAERGDAGDPRWGNAPLTGFPFVAGPNAAALNGQNARFRIAVDPLDRSKLAVQVQVMADDNGPSNLDYVMFGFADYAGTNAWGVKVEVRNTGAGPFSYVKLPNVALYNFAYTSGAWAARAGTQNVMPSWIHNPSGAANGQLISYWNSSTPDTLDRDGARWTVQFRVNLPSGVAGGAGTPDADRARFFLGVHVDQNIGVSDYATGNVFTGCGGTCALAPSTTNSTAAFPLAPSQWTQLASLTGACTGIGVRAENIRSTATRAPHAVDVDAGAVNRFELTPDWGTATIRANTVAADLFIANWGTVSSQTAGWNRLPNQLVDAGAPTTNNAAGVLQFQCTNATTDKNICNRVREADIRAADHQCMQVQMRSASSTNPVTFSNASEFTNMVYENLSETSQIAEISAKGLQQVLGNTRSRDIYLHVVTHNLPLPNTAPQTLNMPALEALRAQVDPSFRNPQLTCDQRPTDRCFPGPYPNTGVCRRPANSDEGYYWCDDEGFEPEQIDGSWWCRLRVAESCVVPAGGGYNPDKSALTPGQVLRAEYPTLEIFPYYDTGTTVTSGGVTRRRLVPMPSFGMYFNHTGTFYGFLRSMVEEYNTLLGRNQRVLQQVGTDTYRITVANESKATLRVTVATQDTMPSTLYQVVGTATPLGFGLGNASFTGIARTRTLDLSRSSVVVNRLLYSGGRELVTNLRGPITLVRNFGALPGLATYSRSGSPSISMQVATLPLIGQTLSIQVANANVDVPPSCPLLIGTATINTSFTISDGLGSPATIEGNESWLCLPGQLVSF